MSRLVVRVAVLGMILLVVAPAQPRADAQITYDLLVSASPDRSAPVSLDGQTVSGSIYAFAAPGDEVRRALFYMDDPTMAGTPFNVDSSAPFDLAGTRKNGEALPYDTVARLADGAHTITVKLELTTGLTQVVAATFTVDNGTSGGSDPSLSFNPSSLTFSVEVGSGVASQTVVLDTTTGDPAAFTVTEDAAWLSVSPAGGDVPAQLVLSADPTGLPAGTHTVSVTALSAEAAEAVLPVTLHVLPAYDQIHLAWVEDPSTTLTVVWRTADTTVPSEARYRALGDPIWTVVGGGLRNSGAGGALHEVTIRSLASATLYEYQVRVPGGAWSESFQTQTAPPPGPADFKVLFFADTGIAGRSDGLTTGTRQVIEDMVAHQPLLTLAAGDFAYFNSEDRFATLDEAIDAWFNQMQPLASRSPMMPAYGNHEIKLGEDFEPWAARFPTPEGFDGRRNYSFDVGDVHFLSIMAVEERRGLRRDVLSWVEQDIEAARLAGQRWIVPFFHVPPFSDGRNHSSNLQLRSQLGPLFERLGVKLVLTAHDQSYERTYPLVDVPVTNTPTSTSLTCYTMEDGITWAKISPGGKLSNKNNSFSQWSTEPAPAWTAFRDNSYHHYSLLEVGSEGSLRLDTFGVVGDGSAVLLIDSFEYRDGDCP
jgi:acid phosphatase type 7